MSGTHGQDGGHGHAADHGHSHAAGHGTGHGADHGGADAHAGADGHGTDHMGEYNRTIAVLAILTAAEFGVAIAMEKHTLPMLAGILILLAMAAYKAVAVGRVFMHLKYDPRILGLIALSPVVLGAPLVFLAGFDFKHGPTW